MDEDECLRRYGLRPATAQLDDIRKMLAARTLLERQGQGDGDTALMKVCCVQLFNVGAIDDVLLIWQAKTASMDADCSIDIQLLCGHGLAETKAYLASEGSSHSSAALKRLLRCEDAGDFEGFLVTRRSDWYNTYYAP